MHNLCCPGPWLTYSYRIIKSKGYLDTPRTLMYAIFIPLFFFEVYGAWYSTTAQYSTLEHVGTLTMTMHLQLGDLGHEVRWTDKLSFLYLSPTSDFSSDILLKTNLQTFLSEATRGNKTSDVWPLIPWRTSEYSSEFLFLSLFRQKNLREFFIHFFRHIIYKPC
jgi:hypothetical protein